MRILSTILLSLITMTGFSQEYYLFIGTYTNGKSEGIYVHKFNSATGTLQPVSIAKGVENPTFLALGEGGKFLYAVNETGGQKPGQLSAFSFDGSSGQLTFINRQPSGGDGPCYVAVDAKNKWLLSGNYSGGSLAALQIKSDGSLAPASQVIQHSGKGPLVEQDKAHVHATVFSPDQQFVFVPDLGIDKVMIYRFQPNEKQPLSTAKVPYAVMNPGSGPRHFTFHPTKPYAYVIEELSGMVSVYRYEKGQLTFLQRIRSHPEGYTSTVNIGSADIHVSPDGKFLYASNRGESNTLGIFSIDQQSGKLTVVGYPSTEGAIPRNFTIDPSGKWVLIANQKTSNIVIFKRNSETGFIEKSSEVGVPNPVCLLLLPLN